MVAKAITIIDMLRGTISGFRLVDNGVEGVEVTGGKGLGVGFGKLASIFVT